jgi:hypothetical protein
MNQSEFELIKKKGSIPNRLKQWACPSCHKKNRKRIHYVKEGELILCTICYRKEMKRSDLQC